MKKCFSFYAIYFVIIAALIFVACDEKTNEEVADNKMSQEDLLKRGEYLVNTIGCGDCHSPKKMGEMGPEEDLERRFSGHPAGTELPKINKAELQNWALFSHDLTTAVGPWGVSFAANLTSDPTGIGNWTLEQFKLSLRKGLFKGLEGSRPLLPPMPWYNFAKLTDEDIEAMFVYFQSTKPIKNVVPAAIPIDQIN